MTRGQARQRSKNSNYFKNMPARQEAKKRAKAIDRERRIAKAKESGTYRIREIRETPSDQRRRARRRVKYGN